MALSNFSASNYITIASAFGGTLPVTFAAWVNSTSSANQAVISINDTSLNHSIGLAIGNSGQTVYAYTTAPSTVEARTVATYTTNQWFHVAGVFSSTTSRSVFLNGASKVTNTTSSSPTGLDKTNVGVWRPITALAPFLGSIAEAAIWGVALTDDEIASLAKGFSPDQIRPQSLLTYLPLTRTNQDIKGNAWTTAGTLNVTDNPRAYA